MPPKRSASEMSGNSEDAKILEPELTITTHLQIKEALELNKKSIQEYEKTELLATKAFWEHSRKIDQQENILKQLKRQSLELEKCVIQCNISIVHLRKVETDLESIEERGEKVKQRLFETAKNGLTNTVNNIDELKDLLEKSQDSANIFAQMKQEQD
ncbi:hypothetical protein NHQ30_006880 [Ciborinia camelliae]|nr:hypothetical protein NHQ30_006880 [Ciborinia camelliae]